MLYVDGKEAGKSDGEIENWRLLKVVDISKQLRAGRNFLTIAASNTGEKPNPAGLIGRFTVEFEDGSPLIGVTDKLWKTALEARIDKDPYEEGTWVPAQEVANFGGGPWGAFDGGRGMTRSPVAAADPFRGRFALSAEALAGKQRVCLEMEGLPDDAAAVTVNGDYAGGVIGKPSRLDITARVKRGENAVLIEPLAPKAVRVVIYP